MKIEDPKNFQVKDLMVSFLCVDSKGRHEKGDPVIWRNVITVKSRIFNQNNQKMVELAALPEAPIRYTTDGSSPKTHGGVYDGPFPVSEQTSVVLAVAEKYGIVSDIHKLEIPKEDTHFEIDPEMALIWNRELYPATTKESYDMMKPMKKHQAKAFGVRATVGHKHFVEMAFDPDFEVTGDKLEGGVEYMRGLLPEGQVSIRIARLRFEKGRHFMDWIADIKGVVNPDEVEQ